MENYIFHPSYSHFYKNRILFFGELGEWKGAGMTLDEAIKTYTSNAEHERTHGNLQGCLDFKQLADWLKELKQLKDQEPCEDCISRQAVLDILKDKWNMFSDANDAMQESIDTIEAISPVTPQPKMGQWVEENINEWSRKEKP